MTWESDKVIRRYTRAAVAAMDDTMAAAAIQAKRSHPSWRNRTGTAEGSIRADATQVKSDGIYGKFGSFAVRYFIWLEIGARGRAGDYTLRRAAGIEFPKFPARFVARLKAMA